MRLTRRAVLKLLGAAGAAAALPACGDNALPTVRGRFFDEHQWAVIDLATDVVLPSAPDGLGASAAGAVAYIDRLLSAFDDTPPAIFAGGPNSGRQPFPAADGSASDNVPDNDFETFLPLSRVQELAWRIRVFGSAATTGGDFNDAVLGEVVGLRDLYTQGIAALDAEAASRHAGATFDTLSGDDRALVLASVAGDQPAFFRALVENTLEGTFAAPEYGGNQGLVGWQLARYDGDSAPLGHAQLVGDAYVDREDQPTSGPSPGASDEDFSDDVIDQLTIAAVGSGGERFF